MAIDYQTTANNSAVRIKLNIRSSAWYMVIGCLAGLAWCGPVQAAEDPRAAIQDQAVQVAASQLITEKLQSALSTQKNAHPKLESALHQLSVAAREQGSLAAQALSQRQGVNGVDGKIQVVVEMAPGQIDPLVDPNERRPRVEPDSADLRSRRGALTRRLSSLGFAVESEYRNFIQGRVSPGRLTQLAETRGVQYVRRPYHPVPFIVSEGVALTGAASNYHGNGFLGIGMKIAIIDLGFDGLTEAIAAGELPAAVITQDFTGTGIEAPADGDHGTAVAEIVHDMAPGAALWLLKVSTDISIESARSFVLANGIDIINFSVGFPGDGFVENTGVTDSIVNDARASGILWVNAAGNAASGQHWRGPFVDTLNDGLHEFDPGVDETNSFFAAAGEQGAFVLTWDDWPASDQDYDLAVCSFTLLGTFGFTEDACEFSRNLQNGTQPPYEQLIATAPITDQYFVAIQLMNATGSITFELYADPLLQYSTADHSIFPPADATGAIAVGAINQGNWVAGPQAPYSSQGPTNDGRLKPDIMGPDDAASFTSSPSWIGTSAAAPHVAGALALLMEANPTFTPDQIENLLYSNAIDMGIGGHDNIFGRGRMSLPPPPVTTLGVSVNPASWAIGTVGTGGTVQMSESNDITVTNTGNVAETFTLRVTDPGTTWLPGMSPGTDTFRLRGLFVSAADAPSSGDFQGDDTLLWGTASEASATQFGTGGGSSGFSPDTGGGLTTGLAAYWKLDEVSGSRADSAGSNNLTDNNTVTQAGGRIEQAAHFTRANSEYLSHSDNATLSTGDIDFTLACWVYLDGVGTSELRRIISKTDSSFGAGNIEFSAFFYDVTDWVQFELYNAAGSRIGNVVSSATLTPNAWHFIVMWHDAAANTAHLQINNGAIATVATTGTPADSAGPFQIGAVDGIQGWDGRIDEVGFWKRGLTAQERTDLYNAGVGNTLGGSITNGVGVTPGGAADLWLSFTAPTDTAQHNQESIVVEVGAVQTP